MIVTERALVARINRALAPELRSLRTCRESSRDFHDLGRFYLVDANRNAIEAQHVDLEELGRGLGALRHGERMAG